MVPTDLLDAGLPVNLHLVKTPPVPVEHRGTRWAVQRGSWRPPVSAPGFPPVCAGIVSRNPREGGSGGAVRVELECT